MLSVSEAQQALLRSVRTAACRETLALDQATGRYCADDVTAPTSVPPADNSAMDGYALHVPANGELTPGTLLTLSASWAAGSEPKSLVQGTAARILTGAVMPAGANAVVIQEAVEREADTIVLRDSVCVGDNIRPAGQDLPRGITVVHKGTRLSPVDIGLLASCGVTRLAVLRPLRVALLNTGDELVEPGQPLPPGKIYNSNRFLLAGLLAQLGCDLVMDQRVGDGLDASVDALREAAAKADLVITSGGVSVGDKDYIKAAIAQLGQLDLWKLNLKPGKPLAFGHLRVGPEPTPILGLPGNPVSAFVTAVLFAQPVLAALRGMDWSMPEACPVAAGFDDSRRRVRPEFLRVRLRQGRLQRFDNQSSGVLRSLQWADGLAMMPAADAVSQGDPLPYYPLSVLINP